MKQHQRKIIGIDFGSTQSSITIMTIGSNKAPELLNISGGKQGVSIPTQLMLDANDDSVIAWGHEVSQRLRETGSSCNVKVVHDFKKYFGAKPKPCAQDEETNANTYAYLFLQKLAASTRKYLNVEKLESDEFVTCIGHPAGWDADRVAALKLCVMHAGFPGEADSGSIYTVQEPVAAMHALRVVDELNFKFGSTPEHFLVIDFGGGTLDICVVKTGILGAEPTILSTAGDPLLGGKNFDDIIETLFFRNNSLIEKSKLSTREHAELREKIREAKESFALSFKDNNPSASQMFNLPSGQYQLTVSKGELDGIFRDTGYYDKITDAIRDALAKARVEKDRICKVILTGGSSKWWFVRELVAKEFCLGAGNIYETQNPFTDVANGCGMAIGFNAGMPDKSGVWVGYRIDNGEYSPPKLVFNPYRGAVESDVEKVFLFYLLRSHHLRPYSILLTFQVGFNSRELSAPENAMVTLYARSNHPSLQRLSNMADALRGKPTKPLDDVYAVYLYAQENRLGNIRWSLLIDDSKRVEYEKVRLNDGLDAAKKLPQGQRTKIDLIPGKITYGTMLGLGDWRHKELPDMYNEAAPQLTDEVASEG